MHVCGAQTCGSKFPGSRSLQDTRADWLQTPAATRFSSARPASAFDGDDKSVNFVADNGETDGDLALERGPFCQSVGFGEEIRGECVDLLLYVC